MVTHTKKSRFLASKAVLVLYSEIPHVNISCVCVCVCMLSCVQLFANLVSSSVFLQFSSVQSLSCV